jgi:hypothetical protein
MNEMDVRAFEADWRSRGLAERTLTDYLRWLRKYSEATRSEGRRVASRPSVESRWGSD